jgi:hypothetical protein
MLIEDVLPPHLPLGPYLTAGSSHRAKTCASRDFCTMPPASPPGLYSDLRPIPALSQDMCISWFLHCVCCRRHLFLLLGPHSGFVGRPCT